MTIQQRNDKSNFKLFLVTHPGLEDSLADEARSQGFERPRAVLGGVETSGNWSEIWRANLCIRGATRVLVRLGTFKASEFYELEQRALRLAWAAFLPRKASISVEASCRKSKLYHSGAVQERIERILERRIDATISDTPDFQIKVRLDHDTCTLSLDTSGEPLHKRGHKQAVGKAPLRETMAANLLRLSNWDDKEPIFDPMCGSGTFVIEAAERSLGLLPGRSRDFAFMKMPSFDAFAFDDLNAETLNSATVMHFGADRDAGVVKASQVNAQRAGLERATSFKQQTISDARPPCDQPGLVILNPPYGSRIGDKDKLFALHKTLGQIMKTEFKGWRVALLTSEAKLAKSTGLKFSKISDPIDHGGLKVNLYQTDPLLA